MSKIGGFVRLMRPLNCGMMGFAVFVGVLLASPQQLYSNWLEILFGFLTGFLLCAAAMTINDYYDRTIDAINEPARPIPSGTVSSQQALVFVGVLSAIGLAFALFISPLGLVVATISLLITGIYLTVGKRSGLPGNFLVSACVAIPFIYGSIIVVDAVNLNVLFFASMAFLANTGREITKGIVDVKGDSVENVQTLAVRYGERPAAITAAIFYVAAVALTPVTWFLGLVSVWFIPFVVVTDIGLIACAILLIKDNSRENSRMIKKAVLMFFLTGLLAYLFGVIR